MAFRRGPAAAAAVGPGTADLGAAWGRQLEGHCCLGATPLCRHRPRTGLAAAVAAVHAGRLLLPAARPDAGAAAAAAVDVHSERPEVEAPLVGEGPSGVVGLGLQPLRLSGQLLQPAVHWGAEELLLLQLPLPVAAVHEAVVAEPRRPLMAMRLPELPGGRQRRVPRPC